MNNNKLSILFEKDGFSFSVFKNSNQLSHSEFVNFDINSEMNIELILENHIKENLYLKQEYNSVDICFLNNQFNIIPNEYYIAENDKEMWISFNTEIYENDKIIDDSLDTYNAHFLYSYPHEVEAILTKYFPSYSIKNASFLFIESIKSENDEPEVFINLHDKSLEIICLKSDKLLFYNLFEVNSNNDIIYYILNIYKQLELDTNKNILYYFGKIQERENLLKMLLNFVRNVVPGIDDKSTLSNFTHYKNIS